MKRLGLILFVTLICACHPQAAETSDAKGYDATGVVRDVQGAQITISHEKIANYMVAMTMPFDVKDTNLLTGIVPGDTVAFHLMVTKDAGWIDQIKKTGTSTAIGALGNPALATGFHKLRDLDPVEAGGTNTFAEFSLTNEFGRPIKFSSFRGRAIALNFVFTSCPFPNFCPRLVSNFSATEKLLLKDKSIPANWQLLTVSFDPAKDTPAVLKAYAIHNDYIPSHWMFLTGDPDEISALTGQVGQIFESQDNTIAHNVRTVVINPNGTIRKIYKDTAWTPEELAGELKQALAGK